MSSIRSKWLTVSALVCILAGGAIFFLTRKPLHQARAVIELKTPSEDVKTQLHLLESDSIVLKALSKAGAGADQLEAAKQHLSIAHDAPTQRIQIDYYAADGTAQQSADFVNALTSVYAEELAVREAARTATISAQLGSLLMELEESEAKLGSIEADNPKASEAERKLHLEAVTEEIAARRQDYEAMFKVSRESGSTQTTVRVLTPAGLSLETPGTTPWTGLAYGVPTTLLGGILFLFSRKRARETSGALARLEVVPPAPTKKREATARNQIIAVTNMAANFTNPETLHDFIETLMSEDSKVLIVDCETGGELTGSVGLEGCAGLYDFLVQPVSERPILPVWKSTCEGVFIMPIGSKPHCVPALLSKRNIAEALELLRPGFTHVVINASSILTAGEMRHLTPLMDGVVFVTPNERSSGLPYAAVRQVEEYGGKILGVIADAPYAFAA